MESSAVTHCIAGNFTDAGTASVLTIRVNVLEVLHESSPGTLTSLAKQSLPEPVLGLSSTRGRYETQASAERGNVDHYLLTPCCYWNVLCLLPSGCGVAPAAVQQQSVGSVLQLGSTALCDRGSGGLGSCRSAVPLLHASSACMMPPSLQRSVAAERSLACSGCHASLSRTVLLHNQTSRRLEQACRT